MLPELSKLLQVQERDRQIAGLRRDITRIPQDETAARARLAAHEAAVAKAQDALNRNEVAVKNLELDIATRRDTIAKLKVQQFETRKNEEFRALGHEIERYEGDVTRLEDQELELMEEAEALKANLASAREALGRTSGQVDGEIASLAERRAGCEARIADLTTERDALAADLDTDLVDAYERLFANKKDAAVVPLEHGTCGGCHMKVTSATGHATKAAREITHCENCGRMLYLVE